MKVVENNIIRKNKAILSNAPDNNISKYIIKKNRTILKIITEHQNTLSRSVGLQENRQI